MTRASDNEFPSLLIKEGSAPSSPSAGDQRLFVDSSDHLLKLKNSSGTVSSVGAGFANPMTTAGDIIYGGASGVATRLAGGTSTYVLTSNGATSAPSWQAAAGGVSDARPFIDSGTTLHGTYGDDFTGALNTGKWTRRTVTSGEETTGTGGSTWMDVDFSTGAASRLYLQTAPAGDFEIILSYSQYVSTTGSMCGPVIIDSSGNGVAAFFYDSSLLFYLGVLSAYGYASFPQTINTNTGIYRDTIKVWVGLKKASTNYSARYSLNGFVWSPYTAVSSQGFTVDRIGFGRILGTPAVHRMSVDRFNVI